MCWAVGECERHYCRHDFGQALIYLEIKSITPVMPVAPHYQGCVTCAQLTGHPDPPWVGLHSGQDPSQPRSSNSYPGSTAFSLDG